MLPILSYVKFLAFSVTFFCKSSKLSGFFLEKSYSFLLVIKFTIKIIHSDNRIFYLSFNVENKTSISYRNFTYYILLSSFGKVEPFTKIFINIQSQSHQIISIIRDWPRRKPIFIAEFSVT